MRFTVKVRPGAPRTQVGDTHGDALVVKVPARPERGRATEAALRALAGVFSVRRAQVHLVTGTTSRIKVVEVDGDYDELAARLAQLRDQA